uniref:SH3 domain-containing protein n=1 Tax=Arion vulgaris TaxID=1028688 RepID=A0A0B7AG05_9EUPU
MSNELFCCLCFAVDEEGDVEEKVGMDKKPSNQNQRPVGESLLSSWAHKGPIQVYIAKYNYDPFEFSPNENPEAELPLTAGDYVLVWERWMRMDSLMES